MKRIGNLFDAVVEPENLRLAFWKASRGKRHRVYTMMTNEQLAKIVKLEISDLGGLRQIEGIGESRIKEYGSALLEVLNESPANP